MRKIAPGERPNWKARAEELGFRFHTMHGEPYWDESTAYAFGLEEVETRIEAPAAALHAMCVEAAKEIASSEALMARLAIPETAMDLVAASLRRADASLYGRFDLVYGGTGPAKMLEYNADTPTSVYEAASFQWVWLEDMQEQGRLPADADQFNDIHEAMIARFREIFAQGEDVHFTSADGVEEDFATVEYLAWCAADAGITPHYTPIERIGLTEDGHFADADDRVIGSLFKLYPWEDLMRDEFAAAIPGANCRFVEPAWKAVLSNKGLLPILWRMFEGHENLLPAFFEDELAVSSPRLERARAALEAGHVLKPVFGREGASVTIVEGGRETDRSVSGGYDDHPRVAQAYAPLPVFDDMRPVIGAWIVGEACVGMGLREDRGRITQDLSRFKPHVILPEG